jgi:hypothetical protein
MQTVYLLKDCYKSYTALKKLYNFPDLSTNIIIVDNEQSKILLLDKRVKRFPFIINTMPTNLGLIPRIAKVLPLEMFMMLRKFNETQPNLQNKERTFSRTLPSRLTLTIPANCNRLKQNKKHERIINNIQQKSHIHNFYRNRVPKKSNNPLIKTIKDTDGGINIILNK